MSEVWKLIQQHLDEYGVRQAALARRMGTAPQTLNSWKKRGMRQLPDKDLLESLAREIRQPYEVVLRAVLMDLEYASAEQLDELGSIGLEAERLPDQSVSIRTVDATGAEAGPVQAAFMESYLQEHPELMAATLVEMMLREGNPPKAFVGINPDDPDAIFRRVGEVFGNDPDLRGRTLALMAKAAERQDEQEQADEQRSPASIKHAGGSPAPKVSKPPRRHSTSRARQEVRERTGSRSGEEAPGR